MYQRNTTYYFPFTTFRNFPIWYKLSSYSIFFTRMAILGIGTPYLLTYNFISGDLTYLMSQMSWRWSWPWRFWLRWFDPSTSLFLISKLKDFGITGTCLDFFAVQVLDDCSVILKNWYCVPFWLNGEEFSRSFAFDVRAPLEAHFYKFDI